jgi:hypothetical protein
MFSFDTVIVQERAAAGVCGFQTNEKREKQRVFAPFPLVELTGKLSNQIMPDFLAFSYLSCDAL